MDALGFDRLARTLAAIRSRRAAMRVIGGVFFGGMVGNPRPAAAACKTDGGRCGDCCNGLTCCRAGSKGKRCRNLLIDAQNCGACGDRCPAGSSCVHGACTCDPFNNTCPNDDFAQCACTGFVAETFTAACVDSNDACDLDRPCFTNDDCPPRSVCLLGCREDDPVTNNRCSTPCTPVA